ncbi:MAG: UvrD-helicase domain-containing protein [Halothiobacillaceae bacterium]
MHQITSDNHIREQALNPRLCCVVQAPAGSGKTELLIQRILVLLAEVERPEEILAITFTKKAAGEMRTRVLHALRAAEQPLAEDASAHLVLQRERARAALARDRERGWNLLQQPARLGIQTIDSLCASLAARLPLTAGFGAPSAIHNTPQELYLEAATKVLERIQDEDDDEDVRALETLLPHLGNNLTRVRDLFAGMLAKRDQWLRHIQQPDKDVLEDALRRLVEEELNTLQSLFHKEKLRTEIAGLMATLCANLEAQGVDDNDPRMSWQVPGWPSSDASELVRWQGLADLLLTNGGTWRKRLTTKDGVPAPTDAPDKASKAEREAFKMRVLQLLTDLSEHPDLEAALHACRSIPQPQYPARDWQVLAALLRLLNLAVAELHYIFATRGAVDFVENALAALRTLGDVDADEGASDIQLALDYCLRHILIDEFQDTSTTQFELLKRLISGWYPGEQRFSESEGRSLFLVGDPMQSIYRFREADVGLFLLAQREGIAGLSLQSLELSTNFRSQAGIVTWVNQVFPAVLAPEDNLNEGAVRYAEPAAVAFHPQASGRAVQLHLLEKIKADKAKSEKDELADDDDTPLERGEAEAELLVSLVQNALATLPHDGEHLKENDRSIAILVRSRSHLVQIIPALRAANIPFQAVEIEQLADQPMVHDLMALTRALLHPADHIAWLAILRAPWCGLPLADLLMLVEGQPKATVWQLMQDDERMQTLSPDARSRLLALRPIFASALAETGRISLRRQVEGLWLALGGASCARHAQELNEATIFFDLLDTLHSEQSGLIEASDLQDKLKTLYAPPASGAKVQLMTIHKSKGLQFHTVILPGLARTPRRGDSPMLIWRERETRFGSDLLLAPIKAASVPKKNAPPTLYAWLQNMETIRERHESSRLLYVATTRAIQRLHLLAEVKKDDDGEWKPPSSSLLKSLWNGIEFMLDDAATPISPRQDGEESRTNEMSLGHGFTPSPLTGEGRGEGGDAPTSPTSTLRRLAQVTPAPRPPNALHIPTRSTKTALPSGHATSHISHATWNSSDETPRLVGTLLHRLFERIALDHAQAHADKWNAAKIQALQPALRRELQHLGVSASTLDAALTQVTHALNTTLNDARGQWILAQHDHAHCEWALSGIVDGATVNAVIDRSFSEQGTRWIIDYKTTVPLPDEDMDTFLDRQQTQYCAQLESYAALLRIQDNDAEIRLGLYFPMLAAWREWTS